jgi:hypothetical protein
MQKNTDDLHKEILRLNKELRLTEDSLTKRIDKSQDETSKEFREIKSLLRTLDRKLTSLLEKAEEFEIIMDTAEIINEEDLEDSEIEDDYNSEWSPEKDQEEDNED